MINITLIGFGNMGKAFYKGLKSRSEFNLNGQDRTPQKLTDQGLSIASDEDLARANYLILGIKPQGIADLKITNLNPNSVIISMLAGISLKTLKNKFPNNKIVRCMPNLAIKNLNGVTGWYGKSLTQPQQSDLEAIFSCLGLSLKLENEAMLDKITLISGSGPGYLAYIIALIEIEALKLGFTQAQAQQITKQTFTGTAALLEQQSATSLVDQVSSKGGVTEAITKHLSQADTPAILHAALQSGLNKINDLKN